MDKMFDYIGNLPAWAQITLILIWLFGSGGGILSIIIGYFKSMNDSRHQERLELVENRQITIQNEQIRIQSEADQAAADRLNTQKLIEVIAASNERWQKVVDLKSERRLEADKLHHETDRMFIEAVNRQTLAINNLNDMLEIQSQHLGRLDTSVQGMVNKLEMTLTTIEGVMQDGQRDLTSALGISITERAAHESSLRIIQQSIHDLRADVNHTLTQNEQQKTQMLAVIDVRFKELEKLIVDMIPPPDPQAGTTATPQDEPPQVDAA